MFPELPGARQPAATDSGPECEAGGQRQLPPGTALHHHRQVMISNADYAPILIKFMLPFRGRKVALEDSDLQFDNIVSLAFHYTQVW